MLSTVSNVGWYFVSLCNVDTKHEFINIAKIIHSGNIMPYIWILPN